jgi:high-affinity iron transporter
MTATVMFRYGLSSLGMMGLIVLVWSVRLEAAQATPAQVWLILHLLDNVAADYPQCVQDGTVLDQFQLEYDAQVEFSRRVRMLLRQLSTHAARSGLLSQAEQLVTLIQDRRPGPEVSALAYRLYWHVIRTYKVEIVPKRPPDLDTVVVLYQAQCAACHGLQG